VNIPSIPGGRLVLRPLLPGDAECLHNIYQVDGVLKYFPNTQAPSLEKVRHFVESQQAHWQEHAYGNWGIQVVGETGIIGWAGLQYLPELGETEVGFLLARPFWGKGFATEAARLSTQYGFKEMVLDHIIALVHPENKASLAVVKKCGFDHQEIIHLWGIDLVHHHITRTEWSNLCDL
jgi:ribosomal-protein-alanine N-acetyltransferase